MRLVTLGFGSSAADVLRLGFATGAAIVVPPASLKPAGAGKKSRRKYVEIDGQLIEVRNAREAKQALQAFAKQIKPVVEQRIAAAVKAKPAEPVVIEPPVIKVSEGLALEPVVQALQADFSAYQRAYLERMAEDDDEEAIFVLTH